MIMLFWLLIMVFGVVVQVPAERRTSIGARQEISPTSICTRWAQQSNLARWEKIDIFRRSCRIIIIHLWRSVDNNFVANLEHMEYFHSLDLH